jgi:hypothetical protein
MEPNRAIWNFRVGRGAIKKKREERREGKIFFSMVRPLEPRPLRGSRHNLLL